MFFPEGDQPQGLAPLKHLGVGKPVKLAHPWNGYPGGGDGALTDGRVGKPDYRDPAWQGFEGPDLDATIDLGKPTRVHAVRSNYLQQTAWGIWLPRSVEYAVSDDGVEWRVVAFVPNDMDDQAEGPVVKSFEARVGPLQARYLRVRARSIGVIPDWHPARGRKAWLFVDEVIVK